MQLKTITKKIIYDDNIFTKIKNNNDDELKIYLETKNKNNIFISMENNINENLKSVEINGHDITIEFVELYIFVNLEIIKIKGIILPYFYFFNDINKINIVFYSSNIFDYYYFKIFIIDNKCSIFSHSQLIDKNIIDNNLNCNDKLSMNTISEYFNKLKFIVNNIEIITKIEMNINKLNYKTFDILERDIFHHLKSNNEIIRKCLVYL